ncbi:MAG: precorrin-8X methylmutase [Pseudomonadota bacterium]
MTGTFDYIRDPSEIYRQSFATVEAEADLSRVSHDMRPLAMRLIHACGMVDVVDDLAYSDGAFEQANTSLASGRPILCDVEMVRSGIIERFLPQKNAIICTLNDVRVADHAKAIDNTRSAAAVDFWDDGDLDGSIVAIGNAPTALFRLLERLSEGAPRPAVVIGLPVGFVGAVESKLALAHNDLGQDYITIHGRRGGSALASAAVNALAGGLG